MLSAIPELPAAGVVSSGKYISYRRSLYTFYQNKDKQEPKAYASCYQHNSSKSVSRSRYRWADFALNDIAGTNTSDSSYEPLDPSPRWTTMTAVRISIITVSVIMCFGCILSVCSGGVCPHSIPNTPLLAGSKQSWGWWFKTLSRPLWRHYDVFVLWYLVCCSRPIRAERHILSNTLWRSTWLMDAIYSIIHI